MYENLILPNQSRPFGDLLQGEVAYQRQQEQINYDRQQQEKYRRDQQLQQNRMSNLRGIDDAFDFKQYETGERVFDSYSMKELQNIKNKALTEWVDLSPQEMQYRLQSEMRPFIEWHTMGKGALANMKKGLADYNKTYSNTDLPTVENLMSKELVTDFFEFDESGLPKRKAPEFVRQRDYTEILKDPKIFGQIVNDTSPFFNWAKGLPKSTIRDSDMTNNKGYKKGKKWAAVVPNGIGKIDLDKDGFPVVDVIHEEFPLPNGGSLKVVPDNVLQNVFAAPTVEASVRKLYEDEKKRTGVATDPSTDDVLFRNFVYRKIKENMPQDVSRTEEQATPKVTVNVNTGASKTAYATGIINGVESALKSGDEGKLRDALSELYGGNGAGSYDNAKILPNGDVEITYKVKDKSVLGQTIEVPKTFILKKDDRYRKSKLKGFIQTIMGSDANLERSPSGTAGGASQNLQTIPNW